MLKFVKSINRLDRYRQENHKSHKNLGILRAVRLPFRCDFVAIAIFASDRNVIRSASGPTRYRVVLRAWSGI